MSPSSWGKHPPTSGVFPEPFKNEKRNKAIGGGDYIFHSYFLGETISLGLIYLSI